MASRKARKKRSIISAARFLAGYGSTRAMKGEEVHTKTLNHFCIPYMYFVYIMVYVH